MTKDLTEGKPLSLILGFSIPVLLGYLFQQFYNVTDTVIVGKTLGVQALAAVGSTGAVNFLIIGFVLGVSSGFAIPVSQQFGAKNYPTMRKYVANIIYLTVIFSVVITALTLVFCRPLLLLMQTPEDIMDRAIDYIWIIFAGIPFIFLYDITSGLIRALGDSKTPVFFLVLSSVLNIALDLIFILIFHWDVQGAALATVISQGVSGIACLFYIIKKFDVIKPRKAERTINKTHCGVLCGAGIPMGLQYSITAIGSVILQASVNGLGSGAVASVTAGVRVTQFFCTPFDSLGTTMATYGGQNTGAGKLDRLGEGVRDSMIISAVYSVVALLIFIFFGQYFVMLFIDGDVPEIIKNARLLLIENGAAYILLAAVNIFRFMIQGMGFSRFAILSGVFEMIARMLMGIFLVPRFGFASVGFASPFAWLLADLFLIPAFIYCRHRLEKRFAAIRVRNQKSGIRQ